MSTPASAGATASPHNSWRDPSRAAKQGCPCRSNHRVPHWCEPSLGDLAGHEHLPTLRGFVVEVNAVAGLHPAGPALIYRDLVGVELLLAQRPAAKATP